MVTSFRARLVLPVNAPPIPGGVVRVRGNRIVGVGVDADGPVTDLGDVILMPGLINAHCHLDYTAMRGAILQQASFAGWIRRINDLKRTMSDEDYLASIAAGFAELARFGTTSVLNIESFPELMTRMPPPPLRTWWFFEMLDVRSRIHTEDVVAGALAFFEGRAGWKGGFGLSPHAPYTTSLALYSLSRTCCEKYGMPFMTHLAETDEEHAMFAAGSGPLAQFLRGLGRGMSDTGHSGPVAHLLENDVLPDGAILTHMNVLDDRDWRALERRKGRFFVVHCPNCHAYFGRPPFPFDRLRAAGIGVCLGTDSLASNRALNMFAEMRRFRETSPHVPADEILRMVTTTPAAALGKPGELGELSPGALADMIAVPFDGPSEAASDAVIDHAGSIAWVMVDGVISTMEGDAPSSPSIQ
jgi:cytosine/adenosine deaminase-related metal-dependent hydrolase